MALTRGGPGLRQARAVEHPWAGRRICPELRQPRAEGHPWAGRRICLEQPRAMAWTHAHDVTEHMPCKVAN